MVVWSLPRCPQMVSSSMRLHLFLALRILHTGGPAQDNAGLVSGYQFVQRERSVASKRASSSKTKKKTKSKKRTFLDQVLETRVEVAQDGGGGKEVDDGAVVESASASAAASGDGLGLLLLEDTPPGNQKFEELSGAGVGVGGSALQKQLLHDSAPAPPQLPLPVASSSTPAVLAAAPGAPTATGSAPASAVVVPAGGRSPGEIAQGTQQAQVPTPVSPPEAEPMGLKDRLIKNLKDLKEAADIIDEEEAETGRKIPGKRRSSSQTSQAQQAQAQQPAQAQAQVVQPPGQPVPQPQSFPGPGHVLPQVAAVLGAAQNGGGRGPSMPVGTSATGGPQQQPLPPAPPMPQDLAAARGLAGAPIGAGAQIFAGTTNPMMPIATATGRQQGEQPVGPAGAVPPQSDQDRLHPTGVSATDDVDAARKIKETPERNPPVVMPAASRSTSNLSATASSSARVPEGQQGAPQNSQKQREQESDNSAEEVPQQQGQPRASGAAAKANTTSPAATAPSPAASLTSPQRTAEQVLPLAEGGSSEGQQLRVPAGVDLNSAQQGDDHVEVDPQRPSDVAGAEAGDGRERDPVPLTQLPVLQHHLQQMVGPSGHFLGGPRARFWGANKFQGGQGGQSSAQAQASASASATAAGSGGGEGEDGREEVVDINVGDKHSCLTWGCVEETNHGGAGKDRDSGTSTASTTAAGGGGGPGGVNVNILNEGQKPPPTPPTTDSTATRSSTPSSTSTSPEDDDDDGDEASLRCCFGLSLTALILGLCGIGLAALMYVGVVRDS